MNLFLTPEMERCLYHLHTTKNENLVYENNQAWIGEVNYSPTTVNQLVRLGLVDCENNNCKSYSITTDGINVLNNDTYVPSLIHNLVKIQEKVQNKPERGKIWNQD